MTEYELYVPLNYNDGTPIESEKLTHLKRSLMNEFGGLTHFPQENDGAWKVGSVVFRDRVVILRVLASNARKAELFFANLKPKLKAEWQQENVLIVGRNVRIV